MTLPRIITEDFGGSPLATAARAGRLRQWYLEPPRGAAAWRAYLERVAEAHRNGAWLELLAPALAATGNAKARLQRVIDREGVVISTGQQATLFGGPLYTLFKAICALALADVLERETGIPVAPVFWAATDDADFAEASWARVAVVGGTRMLRLSAPPRSGVPMNDVPMPGVEQLVDQLADSCGSAVEPDALNIVRRVYTSTRTLGAAYVQQLRELLEPLGIGILDASHGAVRRAAAPIVGPALTSAVAIDRALRERYDAIRAEGFEPQVEHLPGLSLVFASDAIGEKRRVPIAAAADVLRQRQPEALGPNVLLRPIVERFVMPSAAYVAGPGELAYFAQVSAVAESLEVPTPLVLPRWSGTILEPRIERLLVRLGISREDLRRRPAVESQLAKATLPAIIAESLRHLRKHIEADVAAIEVSDRDDLVPPASLQGLRRSLLHRVERIERRYVAAMKRRQTEMMRDIGTAAGALYPEGKRQERVLNFVPFLVRYGAPLLELLRAEAERHAFTLLSANLLGASTPVVERV